MSEDFSKLISTGFRIFLDEMDQLRKISDNEYLSDLKDTYLDIQRNYVNHLKVDFIEITGIELPNVIWKEIVAILKWYRNYLETIISNLEVKNKKWKIYERNKKNRTTFCRFKLFIKCY